MVSNWNESLRTDGVLKEQNMGPLLVSSDDYVRHKLIKKARIGRVFVKTWSNKVIVETPGVVNNPSPSELEILRAGPVFARVEGKRFEITLKNKKKWRRKIKCPMTKKQKEMYTSLGILTEIKKRKVGQNIEWFWKDVVHFNLAVCYGEDCCLCARRFGGAHFRECFFADRICDQITPLLNNKDDSMIFGVYLWRLFYCHIKHNKTKEEKKWYLVTKKEKKFEAEALGEINRFMEGNVQLCKMMTVMRESVNSVNNVNTSK